MAESSKRQVGDPALEAVLAKLERVALGQHSQTRELMASLDKERQARLRLEREAQELVKRLRILARDLDTPEAGDSEQSAPHQNDGVQNGETSP